MSSQIIDDLTHVPNIIASLGIGIAEAQNKLNQHYMASLEQFFLIAAKALANQPAGAATTALQTFITALAPSRYQFTETTLSVHLDLAQHLDVSGGVGVSAGICGVAVNAALSVGFSKDYRGAAECKTVLHAIPTDAAALQNVVNLAKQSNSAKLPELSKTNQALGTQPVEFLKLLQNSTASASASASAASTSTAAQERQVKPGEPGQPK